MDADEVDADRASDDLDAGRADATNGVSDFLAQKARREKENCMNRELNLITERDANKFIAAVFAQGERRRAEDFVRLDALGKNDLPGSRWMPEMFNQEANPRAMIPSPQVGFHESADVVKFEYDFREMKVTTFESNGGTLVRVDSAKIRQFDAMSPSERLAEVNRIGYAMFKLSAAPLQGACDAGAGTFQVRTQSSADEVFAFSTNPTRDPVNMPRWYHRIDAGLYKGRLLFLLYHRISQRIGFGLPEHKLLSKEFREKYTPKRP
jgi:hypothetical protein